MIKKYIFTAVMLACSSLNAAQNLNDFIELKTIQETEPLSELAKFRKACKEGDEESIMKLLEAGIDINGKENGEVTPLSNLIFARHNQILFKVFNLLDNKTIKLKNPDLTGSLQIAISTRNIPATIFLVNHPLAKDNSNKLIKWIIAIIKQFQQSDRLKKINNLPQDLYEKVYLPTIFELVNKLPKNITTAILNDSEKDDNAEYEYTPFSDAVFQELPLIARTIMLLGAELPKRNLFNEILELKFQEYCENDEVDIKKQMRAEYDLLQNKDICHVCRNPMNQTCLACKIANYCSSECRQKDSSHAEVCKKTALLWNIMKLSKKI